MKITPKVSVAPTSLPKAPTKQAAAQPSAAPQNQRYASSFQSATGSSKMSSDESNDFAQATLADLKSGSSSSEGAKLIDSILENSTSAASVKDSVLQSFEEFTKSNPDASVEDIKDKLTSLTLDADLRMQQMDRVFKRFKELIEERKDK